MCGGRHTQRQIDSRQFVALLAHDLRSPLAALRASSELLLDDISSDEQREVARFLARQVQGLDRLTSDVLDAVRSWSTGTAEILAFDLAASARAIVEQLQLDREVRQQFIVSGEARVCADSSRVRAILRNLLSNAIKYSPPASAIAVQVGACGGRAVVTVRDCGDGIAAGDLSRIFAPFYRAPNTSRPTQGHGLGLYIARLLARSCGGDIVVESERGGGSAFTVSLPLAAGPTSA
jgi:signal transduction histidine kinase